MQPLDRLFNRLKQRHQQDVPEKDVVVPDAFALLRDKDKRAFVAAFAEHKEAFINAKDPDLNNILHLALELHMEDLASLIVKEAPELIEATRRGGMSPLHIAVHEGRSTACINNLLAHGADIEHRWSEGKSLLHIAALQDSAHLIPLLQEKGLDINETDQRGATPFLYAVKRDATASIKQLLKHGADPLTQEENGYSPLHIALQHNHVEIINILLDENAVVKSLNEDHTKRDKYTPLMVATTHTEFAIIKQLIDLGANINDKDSQNRTVMSMVLANPHADDIEPIMEYLIEKGADIPYNDPDDFYGRYRKNPEYILHSAIESKASNHVIKTLIDSGMNVQENNPRGRTPFAIALEMQNYDAAKMLLEAGASMDLGNKSWHNDPISLLLDKPEDTTVYRLLDLVIQHGADVNAEDKDKVTPLHQAVTKDVPGYLNYLIANGANIHAVSDDINKETPLLRACRQQKVEAAKTLRRSGARVTDTDANGNTILHAAVNSGNQEIIRWACATQVDTDAKNEKQETALIKALKSYQGIEPALYLAEATQHPINAVDDKGKTLLHYLVEDGRVDNLEAFLKSPYAKDIDLNIKDNQGQTALITATMNNNVTIMERLLEAGAHINTTDAYGRTALYVAVSKEMNNTVDLLLKHDANVLVVPRGDKRSYMHHAAECDSIKLAETLLSKNIPLDKQDQDGNTPLHIAAKFNNASFAEFLLDKGAKTDIVNNVGFSAQDIAKNKSHHPVANMIRMYEEGTPSRTKYNDRRWNPW